MLVYPWNQVVHYQVNNGALSFFIRIQICAVQFPPVRIPCACPATCAFLHVESRPLSLSLSTPSQLRASRLLKVAPGERERFERGIWRSVAWDSRNFNLVILWYIVDTINLCMIFNGIIFRNCHTMRLLTNFSQDRKSRIKGARGIRAS